MADMDREELTKAARHALAGLESFRRFVEGGLPFEHDYPPKGSAEAEALNDLDDAQACLNNAVRRLGYEPADLTRL